MRKSDKLPIWVIFDHPRDFDDKFVARKFYLDEPSEEIVICSDLKLLRDVMKKKGLVCLARHQQDDPVIVETWL